MDHRDTNRGGQTQGTSNKRTIPPMIQVPTVQVLSCVPGPDPPLGRSWVRVESVSGCSGLDLLRLLQSRGASLSTNDDREAITRPEGYGLVG